MTSQTSPLRPRAPTAARGSAPFLATVCLIASLGGLLFGFDTAVISGTVERVAEQYELTHVMQG